MDSGGLRVMAKELRVNDWIDGEGRVMADPVRLTDLGSGHKVIFCFQDWCAGCHSRGFPALKVLHDALKNKGFGFAAIQTVFEGSEVNAFDKLRLNQERYELAIPFGHDLPLPGTRYPTFMEDYRSGGTPWFTIIDPEGNVIFADFRMDADRLMHALRVEPVDLSHS